MESLLYSAIFSLALFALGLMAFHRGWLTVRTPNDRELAELRQVVEWLTKERNQLMAELLDANRKIARLEENEQRRQAEVAQLRTLLDAPTNPLVRVLGLWPQKTLDTESERDAIDAAGFDYLPLMGEMATRENILRELRLDGFTIVEIGAHGDAQGIQVHGDDVLDAGFWAGALNRRTIRIAILLACYSDLSIADAFRRAGVRHVIAALAELCDEDAVRFARAFYQAYADGVDVPRAFHDARLVLDKREREKLVLR